MRVAAVGDIMMGDSSHFLGRGVGAYLRGPSAGDPFEFVRGHLAQADLVLGNLESPLSARSGGKLWDRVYRGPAEMASSLRLGRKTVLGIANNHSFEHGTAGALETGVILDRAGVPHVGGADGASTCVSELTIGAGGCQVQVLATSVIRDCLGPAVDLPQRAVELAGRLRSSSADIRIVTLHWGDEFVSVPSPTQVAAARLLVDAGAHLVLGHHPHVLQPVVKVGTSLVAFSLGNFLFDHNWTRDTRVGGILDVELDSMGVRAWEFVATCAGSDHRPRFATVHDAAWASEIVRTAVVEDQVSYRNQLAAATRRHRLAMKAELLRNWPQVSRDTWHYLCAKRRHRRPGLGGVEGGHGC